jgi:O-antigen biosynthesis protein WbqP
MNRLFAFILILVLLPVIILLIIIIVLDDGFPFFYKQKRVGRNNSHFDLFKFRTMRKHTPSIPTSEFNEAEKYILRTGNILRKYSLDEILNLVNIIFGDLNFVGPRPALDSQTDLLNLRKKYGICNLKPGLTGWAQINGRDIISLEQKIYFEKDYLEKKSFLFDTLILIKTIPYVLKTKDVTH